MHDVVFDQHFKSRKELVKILQGLVFREFPFRFYSLLQSTLIAEFIDEVIIVGGFENFDESDNVSWVFDFRQCVYLIDCELFKFGARTKFLDLYDFDGYNLTSFLIISFVDFTEFSRTYCGF